MPSFKELQHITWWPAHKELNFEAKSRKLQPGFIGSNYGKMGSILNRPRFRRKGKITEDIDDESVIQRKVNETVSRKLIQKSRKQLINRMRDDKAIRQHKFLESVPKKDNISKQEQMWKVVLRRKFKRDISDKEFKKMVMDTYVKIKKDRERIKTLRKVGLLHAKQRKHKNQQKSKMRKEKKNKEMKTKEVIQKMVEYKITSEKKVPWNNKKMQQFEKLNDDVKEHNRSKKQEFQKLEYIKCINNVERHKIDRIKFVEERKENHSRMLKSQSSKKMSTKRNGHVSHRPNAEIVKPQPLTIKLREELDKQDIQRINIILERDKNAFLKFPKWDIMPCNSDVFLVNLSPENLEYRKVKEEIGPTLSQQVTKIVRVQNLTWWRSYLQYKSTRSPEMTTEISKMFHTLSQKSALRYIQHRETNVNALKRKDFFFSGDFANKYTNDNLGNNRALILASVIINKYTEMKVYERSDGLMIPFVTKYESQEFYPEYVVYYQNYWE